ncbi:hypothetical protein JCM10449v2_005293 [Rhodotorula kratochvilovae]
MTARAPSPSPAPAIPPRTRIVEAVSLKTVDSPTDGEGIEVLAETGQTAFISFKALRALLLRDAGSDEDDDEVEELYSTNSLQRQLPQYEPPRPAPAWTTSPLSTLLPPADPRSRSFAGDFALQSEPSFPPAASMSAFPFPSALPPSFPSLAGVAPRASFAFPAVRHPVPLAHPPTSSAWARRPSASMGSGAGSRRTSLDVVADAAAVFAAGERRASGSGSGAWPWPAQLYGATGGVLSAQEGPLQEEPMEVDDEPDERGPTPREEGTLEDIAEEAADEEAGGEVEGGGEMAAVAGSSMGGAGAAGDGTKMAGVSLTTSIAFFLPPFVHEPLDLLWSAPTGSFLPPGTTMSEDDAETIPFPAGEWVQVHTHDTHEAVVPWSPLLSRRNTWLRAQLKARKPSGTCACGFVFMRVANPSIGSSAASGRDGAGETENWKRPSVFREHIARCRTFPDSDPFKRICVLTRAFEAEKLRKGRNAGEAEE